MVILICVAVFLLLIFIVLLTRVTIEIDYTNGILNVEARLLTFSHTVYPRVKKKRTVSKSRRGGKTEQRERVKTDIRVLTANAIRLLRRLHMRVLIRNLTVVYIAGGRDNPSAAAVRHGVIASVLGVSQNVLETAFRVKKYELYANVNFLAADTSIQVIAAISASIWELVYIAFGELALNANTSPTNKRTVKRRNNANKP